MDKNLSRRGLLLAMAASAFESRADTMKLPHKVQLGIIGYDGHVDEILRTLPDFPDVELVAVADDGSDSGATRSALRNPSVSKARRYAAYAEMLNREHLDCVAICNNNGARAAAIISCAARKLNLIAEKPFAITRRELTSVIAAVEKNRIHAGMLLPMRFDPPYLAMKQVIDSGEKLEKSARSTHRRAINWTGGPNGRSTPGPTAAPSCGSVSI